MNIYKITNNLNGKIYIGKDSHDNPNYFGSGVLIKRAIKKYGKENFTKEVVCDCFFDCETDDRERFYIKFFNSKVPNGYNLTDGGEGLINPTEETRAKIGKASSKRNKGMIGWSRGLSKENDERLAKRSEKMKGTKQDPEVNKKRSQTQSGVPKSEEWKAKNRKPHNMTPKGIAGITASNRDPERLKRASERFTGEGNPTRRPEVRKKQSEAAKRNAELGIGNTNYFAEHPFIGENNVAWLGPDKIIYCKTCGKELPVRPNDPRKYCDQICMGKDPERSKNLSEKQKGKELSEDHLANILIAQRNRRQREKEEKQNQFQLAA